MPFPFGDSTRFAAPGDSGAIPYDYEGAAVGLVLRGIQVQRAVRRYICVTPMQDIFDDIKKLKFDDDEITQVMILL